jgi:hypothetical protein
MAERAYAGPAKPGLFRESWPMKWRYDPVTVAEASEAYDKAKPGARHRVTLRQFAKRYRVSLSALWNFRRTTQRATPA